ncbi:MAG: hypothetical protein WKF73_15990 [Nocardioidaceae bacterium]
MDHRCVRLRSASCIAFPARAAGTQGAAAWNRVVIGGTTIIYTIPSLALFSLLLPFTGLTRDHRDHRPGAVLADHPGAHAAGRPAGRAD